MKQLIWLTPGFAAHEGDSKCIPPLQLLAKALAAQPGVRLHIISLHYPYRTEPFPWHDAQVYPAYQPSPLAKLRIWRRAWSYTKVLLREHPEAQLHSFWLNDAALLGHWASKRYERSHWVTLMGQDARLSNRYLRLFPLTNLRLITLSPFHDEQLWQSTGRRGDKLVPWGLPSAEFDLPEEQTSKRPIDVLGVGNLIALKDYATFVEIVARLRAKKPHIRALLLGDGVERERLQAMAEWLGVADNIRFGCYVERVEVLGYMRQSKVLLHPSTYESFGYVFLEALASGAQVVSRPVGIAQAGTQWHLADTSEELLAAVEKALAETEQAQPLLPYRMEETVERYLELL